MAGGLDGRYRIEANALVGAMQADAALARSSA